MQALGVERNMYYCFLAKIFIQFFCFCFFSLQTFGNAVLGDAGFIVIYIMVVSTMFVGSHSGVLEASRQATLSHGSTLLSNYFQF